MGSSATKLDSVDNVANRVEARVGKIPLSGRYHRGKDIEDDYRVSKDELGKGLNGAVNLAYSRHVPDAKYAVKAFSLRNVSESQKQQLIAEVEIFLCMDHPHVCRLIDVYDGTANSESLYLVMECMEGGELFDRVIEKKTFSERSAANAVYQMLLALNYLHSHGIVHRDLKLENFLYDKPGSDHLKLIDFGFSKVWDANIKMKMSCGTLSYVAPEVLKKSYTSQCDLWSLGVIVFILVSGSMPFFESKSGDITKNIKTGTYTMKPEKWSRLSEDCVVFTKSLLQVDPEKRLNASQALEHPWIQKRDQVSAEVDKSVVDALRHFGQASKFRRCCLEMMAWSLSNEDRAKVRQYFLAMDKNKHGTLTMQELKQALEQNCTISESETKAIFSSLDTNNDQEIHYSDFLAAMVSQRIKLNDGLMTATFKKFDIDNSGYITRENLIEVLGNEHDGEQVDKLLAEADVNRDGKISYSEFISYLRGEGLEEGHYDTSMKLVDKCVERKETDEKMNAATEAACADGTSSCLIS